MHRDKPNRLTRREFLGVAGLITATLSVQAGLSLAPAHAQSNIDDEPVAAGIWARLGEFMLAEMQPNPAFYDQYGYSLETASFPRHPLGCPCCA